MKSFVPYFLLSFLLRRLSAARDTITPSQPLSDGQTLISSGGSFEIGFFSGGTPAQRFLGIRYHNIPDRKVVWVANRKSPINGTAGLFSLTSDGNLVLGSLTFGGGGGGQSWSTNTSRIKNPLLKLLESGNLVLTGGSYSSSSAVAWQSFDHPADVLLPGMKIGWDLATRLEKSLVSWKTSDDPTPGVFRYGIRLSASPELVMWKRNGSTPAFRSGPWDDGSWSGAEMMKTDSYITFTLENNPDRIYFTYEVANKSVISLLVLDPSGELQRLVWFNGGWLLYWKLPGDICDPYGVCGPNGVCLTGDVKDLCTCLRGFEPRSPLDWGLRVYDAGCKRRKTLGCGRGGDGFTKISALKPPDSSKVQADGGDGLEGCQAMCAMNCSCAAFAVVGGNCLRWSGELMDLKLFPGDGGGEDVYVHLVASELAWITSRTQGDGPRKKKHSTVLIIIVVLVSILLFCFGAYLLQKRKNCGKADDKLMEGEGEVDLPLFDMPTIERATNNFSTENKLGEGGFGPVYKGLLEDGQEIAVKRLSKTSVQGLDEFMNEVILLAQLQHRNLVRVLGCSIHRKERLLVYEYMPNKSLDFFIFGDEAKRRLLDWQKRYEIILGIARGLLYLHQDSRLKIIHRDLKASNVLLDNDMNPKISDFGTARIIIGDQIQESTQRVVGTYGYMSPEYAMYGIFSAKSDVFSFGVILLEIITGKKNREVDPTLPHITLMGHVWSLWRESRSLELVDEAMDSVFPKTEVLRCMKVGLLCVQEQSEDRPIMNSVVKMLGNSNMVLPQPKRVGFCPREGTVPQGESSPFIEVSTLHALTAIVEGR